MALPAVLHAVMSDTFVRSHQRSHRGVTITVRSTYCASSPAPGAVQINKSLCAATRIRTRPIITSCTPWRNIRPVRRCASSKYLYWDELENMYRNGHSILVYQHFPRENHKGFTARMTAECTQRTGSPWVGAFSTTNVVFLLIPQSRHASALRGAARQVGTIWSGEMTLDLVG